MTPTEEIFSRRGGVKLLLMEMEHLRGALDKQKQPSLNVPHQPVVPCPRGTQDAGVQTSQGTHSKKKGVRDETLVCNSLSKQPVPAAVQVVATAALSSSRWDLSSGLTFHDCAPRLTRNKVTSTMACAVPEEVGTDLDLSCLVSPDLPHHSSIPLEVANGSGRRMGAGLEAVQRGPLQSRQAEEKGTLTNLPSASKNSRLELGFDTKVPAATEASQRGRSRQTSMVDHQNIVTIHRDIQALSFTMPEQWPLSQPTVQLSMADGMFDEMIVKILWGISTFKSCSLSCHIIRV